MTSRKASIPREDYVEVLQGVLDDVAAEAYTFGEPRFMAHIGSSDAGRVKYLRTLLAAHHPDMDDEAVRALLTDHAEEVVAAIQRTVAKAREASAEEDPSQRLGDSPG